MTFTREVFFSEILVQKVVNIFKFYTEINRLVNIIMKRYVL